MSSVVDGIEQLSPEEADELASQGAFLLDVREPNEWSAGHHPDATLLPLGQLADGHAGVLPRDQRIVAVCRSGGRSHRAALALKEAGYDVANLAGGMQAWATAGKPVVSDAGDSGQVV